ncbi:hypothetical protein AK830_g8937 [Neonectria ditissima]|uniref:Methyltransferase-like protein C27D7.08c n=1 Tax=Neonectria ditissima TaxID=78410 RepID=A0A0P7AJE3_9HYPO|nr:hypothetical protein AK830_g8937 [Neonectria ditissima]
MGLSSAEFPTDKALANVVMSSKKSKSPKSPLRAVDPQPLRSPSPLARGNSYPPTGPGQGQSQSQSQSQPEPYGQQRYNPQDYSSQNYNSQSYGPQNYTAENYTSQGYDSQAYNAQGYNSQSYNPQNYPPASAATGPAPTSGIPASDIPAPGLPIRPTSGLQNASYKGKTGGGLNGNVGVGLGTSMVDMIRPSTQVEPTVVLNSLRDLQAHKTNCQFGLREYLSLQRRRQTGDSAMSPYELDSRIREQAYILVGDLRILQGEVRGLAKVAENHRWRRWIIGGFIAGFIPLIRRFFRRSHDDESQTSANDTEHAFRKSKGLIEYIKNGLFGTGRWAKLAFMVLAVLYVFSNEVTLRVARTTQKRMKKLCARIERGDPDIDEKDMKALEGWRWRVLLCHDMGEKRKIESEVADEHSDAKNPVPNEMNLNSSEDDTFRDRRFAELYTKPPNFNELALLDPDFADLWNQHNADFFNDPKCVMQLTKTLLQLDFDLQIELPDDRLCPPVTNRHNYLLWLKGLLDSTSYEKPRRKVVGLDIGTGASCIYPLLGCTERPWSFIATDIDPKSLEFARKNVALNHLQHRINVVQRKPEDAVIPLDDLGIATIDFTMNNPPFYKSAEDMANSAAQKSKPPQSACTGAKVEMVTDGGEVGFVDRILQESLVLRERVQWYTAMFGFLSSLVDFVQKLRENGIDNYAVTELIQGTKTRRWAIAWSFGPMRPAQDVARGINTAVPKSILPDMTEAEILIAPLPDKIGDFAERFSDGVAKLDLISWDWDRVRLEGIGRAVDKVWGRAWRRRRQREGHEAENKSEKQVLGDEKKCAFAFRLLIRVEKEQVSVRCRWLEGHDATAFESFQGFLRSIRRSLLEPKA